MRYFEDLVEGHAENSATLVVEPEPMLEFARDIAWICGAGWGEVRFAFAVRAGDTLQAEATCLSRPQAASENSSNASASPASGTTTVMQNTGP